MLKISKIKLLSAIFFTIFAVIYALPNFIKISETSIFPNKSVNLGLDLKGGSHLLLEVDFEKYLEDQVSIFNDSLRKEFRKNRLRYANLEASKNEIIFILKDIADFASTKSIIRSIDRLTEITQSDLKVSVKFDQTKIAELRDNVFSQSIEIIRMRVDSSGTKEPIISRQGDNYILLQVPGEENPDSLKNILGKTAKLTFHFVDENYTGVNNKSVIAQMQNEDGSISNIPIIKKPVMTGDMLNNAQASFNDSSQPAVSFTLSNQGAKIFGEITGNNVGKRLAIVLDGKLLSAPSINTPIMGGSGIISGSFTISSAQDLALMLRAGALPAPLNIIEERTIGPNLGADSIESGKKAGLIGFLGVVIFMIWSYGIMGIFAVIALTLSLVYILAMLSMFQATLTLPGIAGIILTIGMAVDANVLIYERIREELKKNASNLFAIKQGFETAFATIADSNITTLIAALLLYVFGAGAVKGFAVSLTIGIIASMFSAIIVTKLFVDLWTKYFAPKNLGL
jgi:preprotein translocase subunit SecD